MSAIAPTDRVNARPLNLRSGPLTRARVRRTAVIYGAIFSLGIALALLAENTGLQAFGLGLAFPGGGFLHFLSGGGIAIVLHLACVALTLLLFVVSLALWFGTGNQAAPVAVWLGAAAIAGAMGHPQTFAWSWLLVTALVATTIGSAWWLNKRSIAKKIERRDSRAAILGSWTPPTTLLDGTGRPAVDEL